MSMNKRPKIGLIFTGGGIAARRDPNTSKLLGSYNYNNWMLEIPEINLIAEIKPINLLDIASYEIQPKHWIKIAQTIFDNYYDCNGFVVTHGLDTIIYSASAVSFILQNLGKPVIFTGSRFPPNLEEVKKIVNLSSNREIYKNTVGTLEAKSNLINSVNAATMDFGEVCILFGSKLLRANRTSVVNLFGDNIFNSGEIDALGDVNFGLDLHSHRIKRDESKKLNFIPEVEDRVAFLKVFPNFDVKLLDYLTENDYKGLLIEPYFMGEFPSILSSSLENVVKKGITIVAARDAYKGAIDFSLYSGGKIGINLEIISALDMNPIAALTKLMVVLGQEKDRQKIKKMIQTDWCGEITIK